MQVIPPSDYLEDFDDDVRDPDFNLKDLGNIEEESDEESDAEELDMMLEKIIEHPQKRELRIVLHL